MDEQDTPCPDSQKQDAQLETITIQVPADLHRAFQRCTWIVTNESGCDRLQLMEKMVRDFLIKHGC